VGFFCSPLSNEYLLAAQHFHLDRSTLLDLSKKSVSAIFAGEDEKARLYGIIALFEEENKV